MGFANADIVLTEIFKFSLLNIVFLDNKELKLKQLLTLNNIFIQT